MATLDDTLTFVTGASSNHYRCLRRLLHSLDHHETAPVVVYDLGLAPGEADTLRTEGRRVVRFPFERYPAYFGTRARQRQPCCWKPVLIRETMEASQGAVLWMDAGNLVHERLERVRGVLATTGFYSPTSSGDVERFTHPQVLALLDAEPEILKDANRNGAMVGFGRNEVGLELSRIWRDCALREEIMHPSDWTKDRWRSDQAILSVLVAQFRRRYGFMLENDLLGISYHNDHLSSREAHLYMKRAPMRGGAREAMRQLIQQRQHPARRLGRLAKKSWRKLAAAILRG